MGIIVPQGKQAIYRSGSIPVIRSVSETAHLRGFYCATTKKWVIANDMKITEMTQKSIIFCHVFATFLPRGNYFFTFSELAQPLCPP